MDKFMTRWLFATNHKGTGTLYFIFGMFSSVIGMVFLITPYVVVLWLIMYTVSMILLITLIIIAFNYSRAQLLKFGIQLILLLLLFIIFVNVPFAHASTEGWGQFLQCQRPFNYYNELNTGYHARRNGWGILGDCWVK